MLRFIEHNKIDLKKWDECIDNAINSYIYAYSWYLDIVCSDWDAIVEDDYTAVFPLPYRKKYGIYYIFQPFFVQQLGIFTTKSLNEINIQKFLETIPKQFKYVDVNINKFISVKGSKCQAESRVNIELSLQKDYLLIEKNYSKNLQRNLTKAKQNSLIIHSNTSPEVLVQLFKENRGKHLDIFDESDYKTLLRLIYTLIHRSIAKIYSVYDQSNTLCASALFIESKNRIIFLFSGLNQAGKNLNAMPFLIDYVIKEYAQTSTILDFEGSNDINLARFYKSFGSETFEYQHIKYSNNKILKKLIEALKSKSEVIGVLSIF